MIPMQEPIRVGVVGFGLAGRVFHTAVVQATPGLELASVVQRSGNDAARELPGVRQAHSVEEMLGDLSIQLVVIATPSYSHFQLARQCLQAQRHVVIDKPFTLTTAEAAELILLARQKKLVLSAYQNRRWDGDFQTVQQILAGGELGSVISYTAHYDRYRIQPRLDVWRENGLPGGGTLYDLGPHMLDQALMLFGKPATIMADVRMERRHAVVDDAFDIFLKYEQPRPLTVVLRSTLTACTPGPRYLIHGTKGSFSKWGLDPQEDQIKAGMEFDAPGFGEDPESDWGELRTADGMRRVPTLKGDYRGYYANVRDALMGRAELAVKPEQAWRTTRMIELARESSATGRRLNVYFHLEP
jgi:scyllo-inositol 2-dehydrogenase (NADP+)